MKEEPPYEGIAESLLNGTVVPFFGSAASAVCRPPEATAWEPGKPFLPFGTELARILARTSNYKAAEIAYNAALSDLAKAVAKTAPRVPLQKIKAALHPALAKHVGGPPGLALIASYFEQVQMDRRSLDRTLRESFRVMPEPGKLHAKLAAIDKIKLYVTTNYDDLVERALAFRHPHVLVDRLEKGLAISTDGKTLESIARTGNGLHDRLHDAQMDEPSAPILFKMHGSFDRNNPNNDSYLITEKDYVDYLGRNQGNYLPPYITRLMHGKNLLFLGYSLEDWNVRVILSKLLDPIKGGEILRCWAIVRGRSDAEQKVWRSNRLNIYPMDLQKFSDKLETELEAKLNRRR
jgi:hypothetical protein